MIKKVSWLLFFLIIFFSQITYSQDVSFAQFYSAPLYLNPSFAGSVGCSRIALNFRNPWPFPLSNRSFQLSYDQYVHLIRGGVGFVSWYDIAGEGTWSAYYNGIIYSPKFILRDKMFLAPSVEFGYGIETMKWEKLTFANTIDPRYNYIQHHSQWDFLNISSGILFNSENFYSGIAVAHINQPKKGYIDPYQAWIPVKTTIHAGFHIKKEKSKLTFSPNIIYQRQQDFQQINLGLYINRNIVTVGFWYSTKDKISDTLIAMLGLQYKKFRMGYSYDISMSKLANATMGSHEITLGYLFNCKNKEDKIIPFKTIAF